MLRSRMQAGLVWLWSGASVLPACAGPTRKTSEPASADSVSLRLDDAAEQRLVMSEIAIEPAEVVRIARLDVRGRLVIERTDSARHLTVRVPGLCPVEIPAGPQAEPVPLRPVIELGGDRFALGYDAPFAIIARHNCPEHGRGEIVWRQLDGPSVALEARDAGFALHGRMPSFAHMHEESVPNGKGIVPVSPRTQGRVVLSASWQGPKLAPTSHTLTFTAASRATGLSSVSVSQPLLLAGAGWQVQTRPPGAHAVVATASDGSGLSVFKADAPGRWTLAQPGGTPLTLHSLTHDETPYDCGRSECHAEIATLTEQSPMSRSLSRHLQESGGSAAGSCMLECHVVGEQGLHDGGFQAVSAQLDFTWTEQTRWSDLPQSLRRLGGVRCTACHGPGAIPPPESRDAVLQADVCASCHDAPPRYGHVQSWRQSRMARSDRDRATRQRSCARCHTTAGFLASIGARRLTQEPSTSGPVGIACAACHAPHSARRGPRLVRQTSGQQYWPFTTQGATPEEPRVELCLSCHAPNTNEPAAAVSGTLWASAVRIPRADADGWEELSAAVAHDQVPGGCVGCHGGAALEPEGRARVEHSFRADGRVCNLCHLPGVLASGFPAAAALTRRAVRLSDELSKRCDAVDLTQAHPTQIELSGCEQPALRRALYEVSLVLEDPAAWFHNAARSRVLLDDAERQLSRVSSGY